MIKYTDVAGAVDSQVRKGSVMTKVAAMPLYVTDWLFGRIARSIAVYVFLGYATWELLHGSASSMIKLGKQFVELAEKEAAGPFGVTQIGEVYILLMAAKIAFEYLHALPAAVFALIGKMRAARRELVSSIASGPVTPFRSVEETTGVKGGPSYSTGAAT